MRCLTIASTSASFACRRKDTARLATSDRHSQKLPETARTRVAGERHRPRSELLREPFEEDCSSRRMDRRCRAEVPIRFALILVVVEKLLDGLAKQERRCRWEACQSCQSAKFAWSLLLASFSLTVILGCRRDVGKWREMSEVEASSSTRMPGPTARPARCRQEPGRQCRTRLILTLVPVLNPEALVRCDVKPVFGRGSAACAGASLLRHDSKRRAGIPLDDVEIDVGDIKGRATVEAEIRSSNVSEGV